MKKETILKFISGLIAALFFYAAFSKLIDYDKSVGEMRNQIFSATIANLLTWLIPTIEVTLTFLLLFPNTRKIALWASLFLLSAFTLYIGVVMTGVFGRIPCSCGGILKNMSYGTHLIFNLFFVSLAVLGLAIENGWILYNRLFYLKKERSLPDN
ncbi:MauE/DoxX family redox-associated membrane protein [Pedobacter insulae]|uniref:Methylamine utilisation protein MauE n=1 Tax=Pedobacter insulae TaxID=414048 RepID=A0A1I2WV27_9SPHI|nr:MauE/DoxX family redox-associated membrane protein [Pedobacter insulae]SFH05190.1 Methylamine utilisation protein MauE [Pedobacter insulae]